GWKDRLEFLPDGADGGTVMHRVRVSHDEPAGPVRMELWVDPATDLPMRSDLFLYHDGSWQQFGSSRMSYDETPAKDRFAPPLPQGTVLVDLDQEGGLWRERLVDGVMSVKVGGRLVIVRSVEVDSLGNIFIL